MFVMLLVTHVMLCFIIVFLFIIIIFYHFDMKLLIVGFGHPGDMGHYLASAATRLGLDYQIIDAIQAEASSRIWRSFYWRFRDNRPAGSMNSERTFYRFPQSCARTWCWQPAAHR